MEEDGADDVSGALRSVPRVRRSRMRMHATGPAHTRQSVVATREWTETEL